MHTKKRILSVLIAAVLILSACGCTKGATDTAAYTGPTLPPGITDVLTPAETPASQTDTTETFTMTVQQDSGAMKIDRPQIAQPAAMGAPGTWTVFVYLCGTNLESGIGMNRPGYATDDLIEMLDADGSSNYRYVVQTGGASYWDNNVVQYDRIQRYVIQNNDIELVDEQPIASMGASDTLTSFLKWGVENYPAEKMGLIFWNHGGGSITGFCFDELADDDSLSLRELDASLMSVFSGMTDKFEFIGFDACLMGSVETANILASYADYMVGSEEVEPGPGWNYEVLGSYLAAHPEADGAEVGRVIADTFYSDCRYLGCEQEATMSVVKLSLLDRFLVAFNDFAHEMYDAGSNSESLSGMIRNIWDTDNFGGNNKADGYTNMVDLGGLIRACADWAPAAAKAEHLLEQAVVYRINGSDHPQASGLSVYYPLEVQGSQELSIFSGICVSPYYLSFIDRQGHGAVTAEEAQDYDDDTWFSADGVWEQQNLYGIDEETDDLIYEEEEDDYWEYIDGYETTGESPLITFEHEPQLSSDGTYYFVLDDEGYQNTLAVRAIVYQLFNGGQDLIELGETFDIQADYDEHIFADNFDGYWVSLPDGQDLATYVADVTNEYIVYSSPIYLNGEETNLRFRMYDDYTLEVEGAWAGIDETGASSRDIIKLKTGDVIMPRYYSYDADTLEEGTYHGVNVTVNNSFRLTYDMMDESDYFYAFWIDDLYGDYYLTDFVMFTIEDGELYFTDLSAY